MSRVIQGAFVLLVLGGIVWVALQPNSLFSGLPAPAAIVTLTPTVQRATVTDLSVPFASSEADALVARGFLGEAQFGRLDIGCSVEVIKTTDRAAQVKLISCPPSPNTPKPLPVGTQGWVAKSALNLK